MYLVVVGVQFLSLTLVGFETGESHLKFQFCPFSPLAVEDYCIPSL